MRVITAVCLSLVIVSVWGGESKTFEDLDVEAILKNEDQSKVVMECLMDRGPCGEYQKIRDTVPTMVQTKCSQCSPKQKEKFDQVSKMLLEKYPKEFQMLSEKYSPKSE